MSKACAEVVDRSQAPDDNESIVKALMICVGERVRKARKDKGLTRNTLSQLSGVSPRYLAQLEAGEGNISIGLLKRIAIALEQRIEALVAEDTQCRAESDRVNELYQRADVATQQQIMHLLNSSQAASTQAQRVCLIGLRGAGKSTLGVEASIAFGVPFVELNSKIEKQAGIPIGEIMALYGQEGYRKLEADAIDSVVESYDQVLLAVAGGIVENAATYAALLSRFHTIWLKASAQEHMERVRAQGDERPMAGNSLAMTQLQSILTAREALYEQAEVKLDTSGQTKTDSLSELIASIEHHQFLLATAVGVK